jgi:signal peptidase I
MLRVIQPAADAPDAPDGDAPEPPRKHSGTRQVVEWLIVVGAALLVALIVRVFLFQAFFIPSESMTPTLEKHDRVIVNKLSYKLHDVHRGDIIVFKTPPGQDDGVNDLVKRVIGLPGETVEFRDGSVFVNGKQLDEHYLPDGTVTAPTCGVATSVTVPAGHYWVMGDNRTQSKDSRCFGAIPKGDIVGRAFFRFWPLSRIGIL